ncbi:LysR family transcriptional regulator [Tomitella biformata]|uniref:LysR family transcriptional regulator n=1 Tax=Tomitella biformata TaxID=630403 RepID=UPI000467980C|nr:LysR family transcriptional regulator [Tomitella biformata]
MELHSISYFIAVVDHGSVTAAANALFIAQPSLSQAIRTLEKSLGAPLFERAGRRLELTAAGREFDATARRLLADLDSARARVESVRELRTGRLEIATYSTFSIDPTVELVRLFKARFPGVLMHVIDVNGPDGVLEALRTGVAEVGITRPIVDHPPLQSFSLRCQELVLALPPGLAAALPDPVPRADVQDVPLIIDVDAVMGIHDSPNLLAENASNVIIDCVQPTLTWDLVRHGAGATILSRAVADGQLAGVVARAMDPPAYREVALVTRKAPWSPAAAAFIHFITTAKDDC